MFAEAIPGVILQLTAILSEGGSASSIAITSLTVSALTTGYISTTMSYDWDSDPKKRIESPEFYGYIPNSVTQRAVVFVSMLLLSAVMLFVRALVLVMLGLVSQSLAIFYVCSDMGLYLLFKIVRGDFFYWLPFTGFLEIAASFIMRIASKVVVDYTSNVHLRHPYEVGGKYWSFGLFLTLVSLPMAIFYYELEVENEEVAKLCWNACYGLLPCSLLIIFIFFANVKSEYRKTFLRTGNAKDTTLQYFQSCKDEVKALVLTVNRRHWKSIENDVEEWVQDNWKRWMIEEPDWLDDNMKARIPLHMIPSTKDREKVELLLRNLRRRRSSLLGLGRLSGRRRPSVARVTRVTPDDICDASYLTNK